MSRRNFKPKPVRLIPTKPIIKKDYTIYWLIAGLLLTLIVYLPSLTNGITNWDDDKYLNNPYVINLSLAGILKIFSVFFLGNYHPLSLLSLGIDHLIGGNSPFIFHFTNLLLHLLNTFLVFLLVKRLTRNNLLAILTCMLFGVHTLHVESVAWVSERKDVLYSFFYLLTLIIYTTYASGRKGWYYGLSLLFFLLSLLAKGQAVVLVAILPLIDYAQDRKLFSRKVLSEKVPFLLLSLLFTWIAFRAQLSGNAIKFNTFSLPERFAFASFGFTQYLIKGILPISLSALYQYPLKPLNGGIPSFYWLYIISLPLFFTGSYFLFKRSKIYVFGLGLFFLNLLPLLQLIPVGEAIMADRYFYIPSVGLLLCFAAGLLELRNTKVRYTLSAFFILGLSILSFARCMVWKDSLTLWSDVISKNKDAQFGYTGRGDAYSDLGQYDKAILDYSSAIGIDPKYRDAFYDRGEAYGNLEQWVDAIADYTRAIEIDPKSIDALYNRGIAYGKLGQWTTAIADFSRAIEIDPQNTHPYVNRGIAYGNLRQYDKAIADYSEAIEIDPEFEIAWYNRGIAYNNLGQLDQAIADYSRAIEIDPEYTNAYTSRGIEYLKLGQNDKAIADYSGAIRIDTNNTQAYINRGLAYFKLEQYEMAIADYSRAIEINPDNSNSYTNRGLAYFKLGQFDMAIADYSRAIEINPDNTHAYTNREIAYRKLNGNKKR
jgi:tetratricopeptide (TPR) repeat protein